MLRHTQLLCLLLTSLVILLCSAHPMFAQSGTCNVIPGVVANWDPGQTPPPAWQGADPTLLTDGYTTEAWHYYWESSGTPVPVIFTIPAGYDITAVEWHDHYGDGDVILDANGQIESFTTDLWPLDWHQEPWSLSGVTSVALTTSSNNTKISELSFCGTQATPDTTPPEVVQTINITTTCTSLQVSWPASQDFDDSNMPTGFAEKYLVSWNGQPAVEVFGLSHAIPASPDTFYSITIIAVDASGNQSVAATAADTTPVCPTGGTCVKIQGVSADWQAGSTPPLGWQAPPPSILVDGLTDSDWFYYWEPGPPVPVIFSLPPGSNFSAVRWHDHFGDGIVSLQANSLTKTFSTDLWPLDWHTESWAVSNVSTVAMTTSSNNTKITELTFCTDQGPVDTVPPDAVDDLAGTVTSCTTANFTWSAPADYDDNGPNGTASSYQIWSGTNPPTPVTTSPTTLSDLVPDSSNLVTIIAFDAAGNQSSAYSIVVDTPVCTSGGLDQHLGTVHIIDSFGEAVVPSTSGHQWSAIADYYDNYYDDGTHNWSSDDMCSEDIHNSYWVLADENGQPAGSSDYDNDGDYESYYPTWHPPIHDEFGPDKCFFMHDHGEDPRSSPLYDLDDVVSIGVPFGYVHSKMGNMNGRLEDHGGNKVVVENDFTLVDGNPYGAGSIFKEIGINCNWLSKIHQGSHSSDALGNNLHEYFLNIVCDDNPVTHIRIKELVTWGYPHKVFNEGSSSGPTPCSPGIDWFWAGFDAVDPVHSPDQSGPGDDQHVPPGAIIGPFQDGKREFGCYADRHGAFYSAGAHAGQPQTLAELWKPDGSISAPSASGSVQYSPYYLTRNATRYIDPNWVTRFDNDLHDTYLGFSCDGGDSNGNSGDDCLTNQHCVDAASGRHDGCEGTGGMVSSVDLCVRGSDAWQYSILAIEPSYDTNGQYPGFCNLLDGGLRATWEQEIDDAGGDTFELSEARKYHPDNPFDGTMRGVHPKSMQVYAEGSTDTNYMDLKLFCTDAFGDSPVWPDTSDPDHPICPTGTIAQVISPESNDWGTSACDGSAVNTSAGSSVGAVDGSGNPQNPNDDCETGLVGGGEGAEFVIEGVADSANNVRAPN